LRVSSIRAVILLEAGICWLSARPENTGITRQSTGERDGRQKNHERGCGADSVRLACVRPPFFVCGPGCCAGESGVSSNGHHHTGRPCLSRRDEALGLRAGDSRAACGSFDCPSPGPCSSAGVTGSCGPASGATPCAPTPCAPTSGRCFASGAPTGSANAAAPAGSRRAIRTFSARFSS
jgi:hypothetical protein